MVNSSAAQDDALKPLAVLFVESIKRSAKGLWANRAAAFSLWVVAGLVVLGFYHWPWWHGVLEIVISFKEKLGWPFAAISTGLFGGVFPYLLRWGLGQMKFEGKDFLFHTMLWAFIGLHIDAMMHFQAWLFGHEVNWATVLKKLAVDQLIYVPLWALPVMILPMRLHEAGWKWEKFRRDLGTSWYRRHLLPIYFSNALFWIPVVMLLYCLPLPLQLPIQNLMLCLWVLILSFLMKENADA